MEGITVKQLRGNVDTRLRKFRAGEYDAIVLAEAGLERLGLSVPGTRLSPLQFVPSPNQGTIAVVSRDERIFRDIFSPLDHLRTRTDVEIERTVMEEVGGGCFTPQGIYSNQGRLIGEILSLDGRRQVRREEAVSSTEQARAFGRQLRNEGMDLIREACEKLGIHDEG
jgi:hydroxymethylbilane synthase